MKKASILMAAAVLSVIVSGCAKQGGAESDREFTPTESSVYVSRDGGFSSALVETYDKDYYDQAELQAFLEEAVALYNGGNSGGGEESAQASGPVSLVSCTLQDGVASSVFKYSSADDLIQFFLWHPENGIILQDDITSACAVFSGFNPVHILPADRANLFQCINHPVNRRHPDLFILL